VARAAGRANQNLDSAENLLSKICDLRLDNDRGWQNHIFKKDVAASSFVNEILGSWRLHQARQKKYLGLEGELVRLQKAIEGNQREDMSGPFENHMAGSLADEVTRLFDERERALQEVGVIQAKDRHDSETIIGIIQDARSWNRQALDQVGIQGATLDRVASHLNLVKKQLDALGQPEANSGNKLLLENVRQQLAMWQQSGQKSATAGELDILLDRANKLAFQIAMEVARLGSRGERLLPMSQSLDELNTELRQAAGSAATAGANNNDPQWLQLQARLDELSSSIAAGNLPGLKKANAATNELVPITANVGQQLAEIARSFNLQGDRLTKLGEACSDLTGISFESQSQVVGNADNPPEGGLNINQFDPFGETKDEEPLNSEVDPFSAGDISLPESDDFEKSNDFTSSIIPGEEDPIISQEFEPTVDPEVEKVYDLAEFGAVPIVEDAAPAVEDADDHIYELSEFGAVTMS